MMADVDVVPLYVDLDGTLTPRDTFYVVLQRLILSNPYQVVFFPIWLLRGKAYFKRKMANLIDLDAAGLDYNSDLMAFLREQRKAGRLLVLITASDQKHANAVARHLGIFDRVIGSNGVTNVSGRRKLDRIRADCDDRRFDYAGNSSDDLEVWPHAREAIVVAASPEIVDKARQCSNVTRLFK